MTPKHLDGTSDEFTVPFVDSMVYFVLTLTMCQMGLPWGLSSIHRPAQETQVRSLGWEDPVEEDTATHCSIFAWRPHGQRSWWAMVHGGAQSDTTGRVRSPFSPPDRIPVTSCSDSTALPVVFPSL